MLFDPTNFSDPWGRSIYYKVGDQKTTSKILALELANGDVNKVSFHWNEEQLDLIDWTTEPTESFDYLLDTTVKEIRATNNKVNLFYSGGYDSHTIYEAFRRNNLVIDKFIIWRREWYNGLSDMEYNTALEGAKWIKQNVWPNLEISTVQWRAEDNNKWYRTMKNDWIYHPGSTLKFSKHSREIIYKYNSVVMNEVLDQANTVTIMGYEKPKLDLVDNNWYISHLDVHFYTDFYDPCLHLYYIPKIYLKQAWMLIRWYESMKDFSHEKLHAIQGGNAGPLMYQAWSLALGRTKVFHEFNAYGQGKAMWSHKDPRLVPESLDFLKDTAVHNTDIYDIYNTGLNYVEGKFGHLIKNGNLPTFFSKKYFLKKFEGNTPLTIKSI